VHAFQSGNVTKAISSGGPLLNDCMAVVGAKIAPHASTRAQNAAVAHLRSAGAELSEAANGGSSGNLTKAKQFAGAALAQARIAGRRSG
jgi:hypothetical protein